VFPWRRSRCSIVGIATGLQAGRGKVCIPVVERDVPSSNTSRPAPGHTQSPIEYRDSFPGVKAAGAWILSLTSSFTLASPVCLNGVGSYRYLSLTYSTAGLRCTKDLMLLHIPPVGNVLPVSDFGFWGTRFDLGRINLIIFSHFPESLQVSSLTVLEIKAVYIVHFDHFELLKSKIVSSPFIKSDHPRCRMNNWPQPTWVHLGWIIRNESSKVNTVNLLLPVPPQWMGASLVCCLVYFLLVCLKITCCGF